MHCSICGAADHNKKGHHNDKPNATTQEEAEDYADPSIIADKWRWPSGLLVYVHCSPAKGQRRKIPPLSPPLAIREYFTASHLYQHRRRGSRKMTPAFWPPRLGPLLTGQTTTTNRRRIRCRRRRVDRVRDSPFRFGNRGIGHRGLYSTRGFFATLN